MTTYTSVTVSRPHPHVIEYTVHGANMGERVEFTMHANRYATFNGAYDGRYAHQCQGAADSLWRDTDSKLLKALAGRYRTDNVNFVA